jgi:hypothetical protein
MIFNLNEEKNKIINLDLCVDLFENLDCLHTQKKQQEKFFLICFSSLIFFLFSADVVD